MMKRKLKLQWMKKKKMIYKSVVSKVRSPDGTIFVNVMENYVGEPIGLIINIGKSGSAVAAWAQALGEIITLSLENGIKLEMILTKLSSITSSGSARSKDIVVNSGPEAVFIALLKYRSSKFEELKLSLGDTDEEDDDDEPIRARR